MLKFTLLENVEPNPDILGILKDRTTVVSKGKIQRINKTNIKTVLPVIYQVVHNKQTIHIYEYKGNFKSDRNFYVLELHKTYSLKEIKHFLKNL